MNGWVGFWHGVMVVALATYFGLAFVIAVGGFFDVKKMFRRLSELHGEQTPDGHAGDAS